MSDVNVLADPSVYYPAPPWIFGGGGTSPDAGGGGLVPVSAATPQSEQSSKSQIFNTILSGGLHIVDSLLQAKLYNDSLKAQRQYGATAAVYNPNTGQYQQNFLAQIPIIVWVVIAAVLGILIWKKG